MVVFDECKEIELAGLKTVAAFMNSDGGTLLAGIASSQGAVLFIRYCNRPIKGIDTGLGLPCTMAPKGRYESLI